MTLFTLILIAIGLSMDAFAVSITIWSIMKKYCIKSSFRIAFLFWFFHVMTPIIGWLAGEWLKNYISIYDHWIAFILLAFIWWKMIYDAFLIKEAEEQKDYNSIMVLLWLAVATSIDTLMIWLSFALYGVNIYQAALIIGFSAFLLSFVWIYIWKKTWTYFENKVEILGWLVLIWIWIKILLQHLIF